MIKSSPSQKTFYLSQNNIFLIKPFQCDDQEKFQVTVGIYEKNLFKSYDAFIFKHYLMLSNMVTYYNQFFLKYIDFKDAYMERIPDHQFSEPGLKLSKGVQQLIIVGQIENMIKKWTIQLNIFNTYKILEKINKQNYKLLHKFEQTVHLALIFNKEMTTRLQAKQQIKIIRGQDHKNLIKSIENFETDEYIVVIQESVQGINLELYKNKCQLNEEEIKVIIKQLLSAVNYLHQKELYHGNIKMNNIIIRSSISDLVIINQDFFNDQIDNPSIVFRSQNQILNTRNTQNLMLKQQEKDMYSIGVIFHNLIYGYEPDELMSEENNKLSNQKVHVSQECIQFMQTFLQKSSLKLPSAYQGIRNSYLGKINRVINSKQNNSPDLYGLRKLPIINLKDIQQSRTPQRTFKINKSRSPRIQIA